MKNSLVSTLGLFSTLCSGLCCFVLTEVFGLRTVKEPNSETLLRLAKLVLTLNCFLFPATVLTALSLHLVVDVPRTLPRQLTTLKMPGKEHEFL